MQCLSEIGVDGKDIKIIRNLYWDQTASVRIMNELSDEIRIQRGVRQGCVASPTLFNLYTENIFRHITNMKGVDVGGKHYNNCRYADDTAILAWNEKELSLTSKINEVGKQFGRQIKIKKTNAIAFKIRLARTDSLKISCGSVAIESKSKITYLGLTFDNDMSFSSMGNSVIKKINAKLKFLYRKSAFFGTNERKLLCSALVNPHFEYACNAWYRSVNAKVKHKLQTAQNKMIRYLPNYGRRRHIGFSDFKKSNCLDINARVDYKWVWSWCSIFLIMLLLPTCVTLIESRIVTTHAKVTQRMLFHV